MANETKYFAMCKSLNCPLAPKCKRTVLAGTHPYQDQEFYDYAEFNKKLEKCPEFLEKTATLETDETEVSQ